MSEGTKILLVDDHQLFREGLRGLLEKRPGMLVVGEAEKRSAHGQAARPRRAEAELDAGVRVVVHLSGDRCSDQQADHQDHQRKEQSQAVEPETQGQAGSSQPVELPQQGRALHDFTDRGNEQQQCAEGGSGGSEGRSQPAMMTCPRNKRSAKKRDQDDQWNRHGMKIPAIIVSGGIAPTAISFAE